MPFFPMLLSLFGFSLPLTVWKFDRLGRSLRDLIAMVEDFDRRGVNFRSLTEEISTTTPDGKLTFHIFAALPSLSAASSSNEPAKA